AAPARSSAARSAGSAAWIGSLVESMRKFGSAKIGVRALFRMWLRPLLDGNRIEPSRSRIGCPASRVGSEARFREVGSEARFREVGSTVGFAKRCLTRFPCGEGLRPIQKGL